MKSLEWTSDSHHILEQANGLKNYNRWLMSHFAKYFGRTILEIGSGQGALSKLLSPKSIVILSDVISEYLESLKKVFTDPVINLNIEKDTPKNLLGKMDTIFSSNVFEHLKGDVSAMKNCYLLLEEGGYFLMFVPARPEIYGRLDEEMGHYRRYTKKDLRQKAEAVGFKVEKIYYANLPGYFLWWGRGLLLGKLFKIRSGAARSDSILAKIFDSLIVPFLYVEKYLHPPFGQSLVLIAKKSNIQAY
jgi:SAM-dependent methyltransferase